MSDFSRLGRSSTPSSGVLGPESWAEVVARSSGWSSDGSAAHDFNPLNAPHDPGSHNWNPRDLGPQQPSPQDRNLRDVGARDRDTGDRDPGDRDPGDRDTREPGACGPDPGDVGTDAGFSRSGGEGDLGGGGRASWVLVGYVREAAEALAVGRVPESPAICLAEVEDLVFARDRLTSAIVARVGRLHATGEAKSRGHASTKTWLRSGCGVSMAGAGHLVALAAELARLEVVRARFASGTLHEGMVSAICAATARLTDEQARGG